MVEVPFLLLMISDAETTNKLNSDYTYVWSPVNNSFLYNITFSAPTDDLTP